MYRWFDVLNGGNRMLSVCTISNVHRVVLKPPTVGKTQVDYQHEFVSTYLKKVVCLCISQKKKHFGHPVEKKTYFSVNQFC